MDCQDDEVRSTPVSDFRTPSRSRAGSQATGQTTKKRRRQERVKLNQTGFSAKQMQKEYRTPGRKKRKSTSMEPAYVDSVFESVGTREPSHDDISESAEWDVIVKHPHHFCSKIKSVHLNEGVWTPIQVNSLKSAIKDNLNNGPFGGVHWEKVASAVKTHCMEQCKEHWYYMRNIYELESSNRSTLS
mmetsp:Transcript_2972/g.4504  ORF Transcript_2972/g.4504 Transcript_2972/m.4504 type:complete len:187 (+) Transcript_2972:29-589(+)